MSKIKKEKFVFLKKFFMIIGVIVVAILLLLLILIAGLVFMKPYGIDVTKLLDEPITSSYDHPYLNTQQEDLLKSVGIDPADVPTQITPAQEQCAVEALGLQRVNEIKSGSAPTITDILKTKSCLD